jgi:DNA primase
VSGIPAASEAPTNPNPATASDARQWRRLVVAHEHAAAYFFDHIHSETGRGPREYLRRRGIAHLLSASDWVIGYAPPGWTGLTDHLRGAGFDEDEILRSGLGLVSRRGSVVDRFRDRVMFGFRNPAGDLVGFTGRSAPGERNDVPKYLNSPHTPIYDKGSVLFGLAEQREHLASGATPVIVEGPVDVLAVATAYQDSTAPVAAVAPCGTALTNRQADLLAATGAREVLVSYDSDAAGDRAATAAYHQLTGRVPKLSTARLPPGDDPSDLLAHGGPERLRAALGDPEPLADRVIDRVLRRYRDLDDNADARVAALHQAAPLIASMRPADAGREVARVARALGFDHPLVTEEVTTALTEQPAGHRPSTARRGAGSSTVRSVRRARPGPMRLP